MLPVLFRFRGTEIHSYTVFLFLGLTFGIIAGTYAGTTLGLDPLRLYSALLLLTIAALAGSRMLYVLTHLDFYLANPSSMFSRGGGAALYGGLILALACSPVVLALAGLPLGTFWDAATFTLLVALIIAKIGCLLNGCCAGRPSSGMFALNLPNASGETCPRVPSQLLECGLATVLLSGAMVWRVRPFGGALFLTTVAIYATARIPLGFLREKLDGIGRVNIYNAISVTLIVGSVLTIAMNTL